MFTVVVKSEDAVKKGVGVYEWNVNWNTILDMSMKPNTVFEIEHSFAGPYVAVVPNLVFNEIRRISPVIIGCNLQTNGYTPPTGDTFTRGGTNTSLSAPFAHGPNNPVNVAISNVVYASVNNLIYSFSCEKNTFTSKNVYNMSPLQIKTYKQGENNYALADCDGIHTFTFLPV